MQQTSGTAPAAHPHGPNATHRAFRRIRLDDEEPRSVFLADLRGLASALMHRLPHQAHAPDGTAILVRGVNDVGSAVAHVLFRHGYRVAIHDDPHPAVTRRQMAFTDAVFDGAVALDGIWARRVDTPAALAEALGACTFVAVCVLPIEQVLAASRWGVLVDARMRKRAAPEAQRGLAPLVIGLGPGFVAGGNVDLAIETSWERLAAIVPQGATMALRGEPRAIDGYARERFVYAPVEGAFCTPRSIGDAIAAGALVARIGDAAIRAPLTGVIRGLVRDGVPVTEGAKVLEIDPRGAGSVVSGLGERPRRIAEAVRTAITNTQGSHELARG